MRRRKNNGRRGEGVGAVGARSTETGGVRVGVMDVAGGSGGGGLCYEGFKESWGIHRIKVRFGRQIIRRVKREGGIHLTTVPGMNYTQRKERVKILNI